MSISLNKLKLFLGKKTDKRGLYNFIYNSETLYATNGHNVAWISYSAPYADTVYLDQDTLRLIDNDKMKPPPVERLFDQYTFQKFSINKDILVKALSGLTGIIDLKFEGNKIIITQSSAMLDINMLIKLDFELPLNYNFRISACDINKFLNVIKNIKTVENIDIHLDPEYRKPPIKLTIPGLGYMTWLYKL